jgi:hypothetical protein
VKQKTRKQAQEKQDFIVQEIEKLKKAKLIREVDHPTWIANLVVVPKANGSGRLCVDFTSLNKGCPKDPYTLPRIDQIIDSTTGCDLLCFLDAFSGYHQIKMVREDKEKTAFITPCGVYCYVCMPFGLKNAGATFQRLMRKALGAQMGRNAEAYINDIVVKTRESHTFIEDLEETFANLRKVNIKLNPAKCAFGVPSGKLLGLSVFWIPGYLGPPAPGPLQRPSFGPGVERRPKPGFVYPSQSLFFPAILHTHPFAAPTSVCYPRWLSYTLVVADLGILVLAGHSTLW